MPLKYALGFIFLIVVLIVSVNLKNKSSQDNMPDNLPNQQLVDKGNKYNQLKKERVILHFATKSWVICGAAEDGERTWPNLQACLDLSQTSLLDFDKNSDDITLGRDIVLQVGTKSLMLNKDSQRWESLEKILGEKQVNQLLFQ